MAEDTRNQNERMYDELLMLRDQVAALRSEKEWCYKQIERLQDEKKALRNEVILGAIDALVSFSEA